MLVQPHYTLTFYPAPYPSVAGPVALLSASHHVEAGSLLGAQMEQLIQRAEYVRGTAPSFFMRGSRSAGLDWEEVQIHATPAAATAAALDTVDTMPDSTGWMRIDIPSSGRAWAVTPAAIRSVSSRSGKSGASVLLYLRWTVNMGEISGIATTVPVADYLLAETGFTLFFEDDSEIALETLT